MNLASRRVLVTGTSGFVGRAIADALLNQNQQVVAPVRQIDNKRLIDGGSSHLFYFLIDNIGDTTSWGSALCNVKTVVHCAAITSLMRAQAGDPLAIYREVNVAGTLQLARNAAADGVQRFVFLSSIKVNGELTLPGRPFTETSAFSPKDHYAQSKVEAEEALMVLARQTGMEIVIIRSPLVVGQGVKGNLDRMIKWLQLGVPLPLGMVQNKRSLVSLDNLVSLVLLCADRGKSPQAVNQVFCVADEEDLSTPALLNKLAQASGRPSRLFPVPPICLRSAAILLRKQPIVDRLLGNLQVDTNKVRTMLGWRPVVSLDEQLAAMFKRNHQI